MSHHFLAISPFLNSVFALNTPVKNMVLALVIPSVLASLTACTSNVRFDDAEYRAVGLTQPQNGKISNPPATHYDSPEQLQYDADGYNEISGNINRLSRRYGHDLTIRKIIQTIRIHCTAQPLTSAKQANAEPLQFCHYQFPKTCGSHRFSLIENTDNTALVYHDRVTQRNILDQIRDNEYAQPGLWDFADQVSVSSPYPEQQLYYQFSGQTSQAWVVGINDKDREQFGTLYAKAVNETLACF
ncbi:hypothetical protein [Alkalimarinus alittae]|uniref:Lipoprotein n=1 Tax=Alkalimarinus alittae TaxID=2961619 RepID=A0ABY6N5S3_9ALTE|nr:hypothetical protein [Alkalimarinus alittae]UZE97339.1 hypothetical protein NKI27_06200 [Alkalimarinus alittae]